MKGSAQKFFNKAITNIDKSSSNFTRIRAINRNNFWNKSINTRRSKYLNNSVEQDHRNIKRRIAIDTGLKSLNRHSRLFGRN